MILQVCKKLNFPEESLPVLEDAYQLIREDAETAQWLDDARDSLLTPDCKAFVDIMSKIAKKTGVHPYTADMVLQLYSVEPLRQIYRERGLSEKLFWDTMEDLRYKLDECWTVYKVWGTSVAWWQKIFFVLKCFKLGRLEYESRPYLSDIPYKGMEKGKPAISIHIPSGSPLDMESVMDSLRQAYAFFKDSFADGIIPFNTFSWLLYPPYVEKVFPKGGNIQRFAAMFHIVYQIVSETYSDFSSVFDCPYEGADFAKLPQKTALQRNMLAFLQQGNPMGAAYGIFFYDKNGVID